MRDAFVGIDQSYSGFAMCVYMPETEELHEYLWKYPPAKYGTGVDRLLKIQLAMMTTFYSMQCEGLVVKHVCMEGYAADRKFGREQSGELGSVVKQAVRASFDPPVCYPTIVPPTSLKKFVTGAGNAAKDNVLLGVYKKWGKEFKDNNLADAYGLARMAEALHTGRTAFKYEEEALAKLHPHTESLRAA